MPRVPKRPDYGNATPEDLARALLRPKAQSVNEAGIVLHRRKPIKPLLPEDSQSSDVADDPEGSVD